MQRACRPRRRTPPRARRTRGKVLPLRPLLSRAAKAATSLAASTLDALGLCHAREWCCREAAPQQQAGGSARSPPRSPNCKQWASKGAVTACRDYCDITSRARVLPNARANPTLLPWCLFQQLCCIVLWRIAVRTPPQARRAPIFCATQKPHSCSHARCSRASAAASGCREDVRVPPGCERPAGRVEGCGPVADPAHFARVCA